MFAIVITASRLLGSLDLLRLARYRAKHRAPDLDGLGSFRRRANLVLGALFSALLAAPCTAQAPATPAAEDFAKEYETRIQQVADVVVVPRLMRALSSAERMTLGDFRVKIVRSKDSLRIGLEPKVTQANRLEISVGNMFVHDLLVDASVVWASMRRDDDAITYAIDVTEYALQARRPGTPRAQPRPFWELLGWDQKKYESVQNDAENQKLFTRARVQTLAWIVARAISTQLSDEGSRAWISKSTEDEEILLARTADLMRRAKFSPVPALGASIFFYGVQHPNLQSREKWLCSAKQMLNAAASVAKADRERSNAARAERVDAAVAQWQRVGRILDVRGNCKVG